MNIDPIILKVKETVDSHRLSEGAYTRWLIPNETQKRKMGINEYGCADAANILYTIGMFENNPAKRACWVDVMQKMQNPETGMFFEGTHHTIHTTAHCCAALELFDAQPLYVPKDLLQYLDQDKLYSFLEGLDWENIPWSQSHKGAGLFASLIITHNAPLAWQDWYFDWLSTHCDPNYGMSYRGKIGKDIPAHHMYGWFHYFFNHEFAKRPIPYPDKLIDSCIDMYKNNAMGAPFGVTCGFMEIDWVFCMNRASRQTKHRYDEVKALLADFAPGYINYLMKADPKTDRSFDDLHMLFGAMCAVAELQSALPGQYKTTIPMKITLDRRPFI